MSNLPKPGEHVIVTPFDNGEGVLIDLNSKRYYQLNETALLIWQGLEAEHSREQIVAALVKNYEVTETHAQASFNNLLDDFVKNGLIASPV